MREISREISREICAHRPRAERYLGTYIVYTLLASAQNIVRRTGIGTPSLRPGFPQGKFQGAERGVLISPMNFPKRSVGPSSWGWWARRTERRRNFYYIPTITKCRQIVYTQATHLLTIIKVLIFSAFPDLTPLTNFISLVPWLALKKIPAWGPKLSPYLHST